MAMIGGIKKERGALTPDQVRQIRFGGIGQIRFGGIGVEGSAAESLEIESAAKLAVEGHNKKENSSLEFGKVVDAKRAVVSGFMYFITVEATNGGKKELYFAKVWVKPCTGFMQVMEFSPL